jgi:hypothetical protein
MGGLGSGRRRQNPSPSRFCKIDVRLLQRGGKLTAGQIATLQWTKDNAVVGTAHIRANGAYLTVRYGAPGTSDTWQYDMKSIYLSWTSCYYGGRRAWFLCPSTNCGRRVAILYGGRGLACRHCRKLSYPTQRIAPESRALARAQCLKVRLGGSVDMSSPIPPKPKGMHSWTYTRLAIKALAAEAEANKSIVRWLNDRKSKIGNE